MQHFEIKVPVAGKVRSEQERVASFGRALDALRQEVEATLGESDVAYLLGVRGLSRRLEWLGRGLIHLSFEPMSWTAGVAVLSMHKLLELIEIGHSVLHDTYDHLPGGEELRGETFRWKAPIDEASWRVGHNLRHHQFTNVSGRDPDLDFGLLRLGAGVPFRRVHRLQPVSNLVSWLYFSTAINAHVSGMIWGQSHATAERKTAQGQAKRRRALAKLARYYGREYVLFPALAGPFFWKTLAGNVASELVRDVYAAATIYCGHVGATEYPQGSHAKGRADWYVMQVEGSRDFQVSGLWALLCGGLECQIEHHLFPRLPPNRLREIAPRVRAICAEHGVTYRSDSWPRVLRDVRRRLRELSSSNASETRNMQTAAQSANGVAS